MMIPARMSRLASQNGRHSFTEFGTAGMNDAFTFGRQHVGSPTTQSGRVGSQWKMIRRPPFNSLATALKRLATLTPDASFPAHETGREGSCPKKQRKNLAVRLASASRAPGATLMAASILSAALVASLIALMTAWRSAVRHCAAVARVHSAHGSGKSKTGAASSPNPAKALRTGVEAQLLRLRCINFVTSPKAG
jgi:hypothetical protein